MSEANLFYDMPPEELAYLDSCAAIRQCSRMRLVRELARVVARDQLVLATLDDDSRPMRESRRETRGSVPHGASAATPSSAGAQPPPDRPYSRVPHATTAE